eukprot:Rhum_TRINITY_DN4865_c0_g1::Rhum_TRINITY_DN4865_c0_g1_i1::g.15915::m.15915
MHRNPSGTASRTKKFSTRNCVPRVRMSVSCTPYIPVSSTERPITSRWPHTRSSMAQHANRCSATNLRVTQQASLPFSASRAQPAFCRASNSGNRTPTTAKAAALSVVLASCSSFRSSRHPITARRPRGENEDKARLNPTCLSARRGSRFPPVPPLVWPVGRLGRSASLASSATTSTPCAAARTHRYPNDARSMSHPRITSGSAHRSASTASSTSSRSSAQATTRTAASGPPGSGGGSGTGAVPNASSHRRSWRASDAWRRRRAVTAAIKMRSPPSASGHPPLPPPPPQSATTSTQHTTTS